MANYSQRRGLQNVSSLRRKLRRIAQDAENTIKPVVEEIAEAIKQDAIARAPQDSGDLVRSIDKKLSADGLTAVIGPAIRTAAVARTVRGSAFANRKLDVKLGAKSKKALFQFFKGYWIEFGTKGAPERNIPPQPARPFMGPAFDVNRDWGMEKIKDEINATLKRAADG